MSAASTSTSSPLATIRTIAADIKLAHSVFALPFALLAAFMAALPTGRLVDWPRFSGQLGLVVLAMIFARTVAMLANRWLDREIDARNPRTAGRAIPAGRLTASRAVGAILFCSVVFLFACAGFGLFYGNWWPLILGVPVLLWISAYGFFKRFTALCHLWLGASLAISPLAAVIAIDPVQLAQQPAVWLLGGMVLCWVAGFDVIYALQDIEVDRREGLHSIPARFGLPGSLWIARGLHLIAIGCLVAVWLIDARFETALGIGLAIVAGLLIYEHATVSRWGTMKIALAFFTLNGLISLLLGALGIVDLVLS